MKSKVSIRNSSKVAAFLEERATTTSFDLAPIFYNDLATHLGFDPVDQFWSTHPLCIFDRLDREDVAAGRPLRTALVVSKDRGLPGDGFFKTMTTLRGQKLPARNSIQETRLWTDEIQRLITWYQKPGQRLGDK